MEPRDWARRRRIRRLLAGGIALAAVSAGVVGLASFAGSGRSSIAVVPLDGLPQGASAQILDGVPVVMVRNGSAVTALEAKSGRNHPVKLCAPPDGDPLLVDEYGSMFDLSGNRIGGSSPSLTAFDVSVGDSSVSIDTRTSPRLNDPAGIQALEVDLLRWKDAFKSPAFCPTITTTH